MCKYAFKYSSLSFFFFLPERARVQMQSIYLHVRVCDGVRLETQ